MSNRSKTDSGKKPGRTALQTVLRAAMRGLWKMLTRLEIEGIEVVPAAGPFLVAINHLSLLDSSLVFCFVPRVSVHMVHEDWRNWFTKHVYNGVFVAQKTDETRSVSRPLAILQILEVLRTGTGVLIAPEGGRSPNGAMRRGHPGVACLATLGRVPVVPIAMYGQENLSESWKRLRRAPVCIRVGAPIELPEGEPDDDRMQDHTDRIMAELARMLPAQYRGAYAEAVREVGSHTE